MSKPKSKTNLPSKKEGNKYDKIIKENLEALIPALFRKALGLKIKKIENLPATKHQTTIEREPDFLKIVYDEKYPKGGIQQLEFQVKDEEDMDGRLLEYLGILYRRYKMPIVQTVVFLGETKSKMNRNIAFGNLVYHFDVINLSEISFEEFLYSTYPEEVILSILANPGKTPREEIIRMILERLVELKGKTRAMEKFIRQLEIISILRNLQEEVTKKINDMGISYDIKKDIRFRQGIEEGIEQGEDIKAVVGIRNMSKEGLADDIIAKYLGVSEKYVQNILQELKEEKKIVALLKKQKLSMDEIAKKLKISIETVWALKHDLEKK